MGANTDAPILGAPHNDHVAAIRAAVLAGDWTSNGKDEEEQDKWLTEICECDDPEILVLIGEIYNKGQRVRRNSEKAVALFERAKIKNCAMGCYMLGHHYYSEFARSGGADCLVRSAKYWRCAARAGHAISLILRHRLAARGMLGAAERLYSHVLFPTVIVKLMWRAVGISRRDAYWRIDDLATTDPSLVRSVKKFVFKNADSTL